MPDKEIMLQIRKREEDRPWAALDELDTMPTDITAELFRAALGSLGKCSATVARDGDMEYCDRFTSHPAHRLEGPVPAGSPGGINALIADSVARYKALDAEGVPDFRGSGDLADPVAGQAALPGRMDDGRREARRAEERADFPGQASGDEVAAYLRGEADNLPGEPLQPSSVRDQTAPAPPESPNPGTWAMNSSAPLVEIREDALRLSPIEETMNATIPPLPLLGQPGDAGSSYGHDYIPPGGVPATYAELMTPVPLAALPPHISHSQIGTVGECGVKYRLQRIGRVPDRDGGADWSETLHEIPQWALIGGAAFHAAIEALERWACVPGNGDMNLAAIVPNTETMWSEHFGAEIQKTEASVPVPRSRWRASKGGAEGETWWNVNGPLMIERYLKARPAEPTAMIYNGAQEAVGSSAVAIELERTVAVQTPYGDIDYRAIIDRVTVRSDPQTGATTLVIRDYKTGDRMPYTHEQLGEYANVLRLLGVPPRVRIVGTYFNARKGVWTPEIDLDRAYSPEWFTYHVTTGHAQRLALTQGPTPARPSTFCGGCPVRWACPVREARS
jgi:hypothetical protein